MISCRECLRQVGDECFAKDVSECQTTLRFSSWSLSESWRMCFTMDIRLGLFLALALSAWSSCIGQRCESHRCMPAHMHGQIAHQGTGLTVSVDVFRYDLILCRMIDFPQRENDSVWVALAA